MPHGARKTAGPHCRPARRLAASVHLQRRLNAERLVSGHADSGISGVVPAVRVLVDLRRVGSEGVLQGSERLGTQLVAVAYEECPAKLAMAQDLFRHLIETGG